MVQAKRARTAETPKLPSLCLRLRAPYFYPDYICVVRLSSCRTLLLRRGRRQKDRQQPKNVRCRLQLLVR